MMRKVTQVIILSSILMILATVFMNVFFRFQPDYPILKLDKGWNIIYRNEQYVNTKTEHLSNQVGSTFSRGDYLSLNLAKPIYYETVPFPYLLFKTQFCAYSVYLDGVLIASEFFDDFDNNEFVGAGYHLIALPNNFQGKKLSIRLVVTENNTSADVISPLIGNFDDLYRYCIRQVLVPALIGIFMIVFGQVFLIISLLFSVKTTGVSTQIICSIISSLLGIWTVTSYDVTDFVLNCKWGTALEYSSLYLILPLMYMLVLNIHKQNNNSVIAFLGYSSFGFSTLFILLHGLNIVHINQFLPPYLLMCTVGMIMLGIYNYLDIKGRQKNSSTRVIMIGIDVLALSLILYMFSSATRLYIDYRQNPLMSIVLPAGCLFFTIVQLLNHFIFMTRSFAQRKEYASLSQIAYIDNLTGIPNRVSCDKKFDEMKDTNMDYCLLSLDLNGLKEVNDNSGHPAGDRLLKSFAQCLEDVFKGLGDCYRIGGDEFIVVFQQVEKEVLDKKLKELDEKLRILDETDPEANHSVSYGYAFRSETAEKDTHAVFMLADKRMYAYKRKYYSHMMKR